MWFSKPNVKEMSQREDFTGLIKALDYKDSLIRAAAARALQHAPDLWRMGKQGKRWQDAIVPLAKAVHDTDNAVAREATDALNQLLIRGGGYITVQDIAKLEELGPLAVHALHTSLASVRSRNDRSELKIKAIEVLARIGNREACKVLVDVLKEDVDLKARSNAARTLGMLGDKEAVEILLDAYTDNDSSIRQAAIDVLGKLGDEGTNKLIDAVENALRGQPEKLLILKDSRAISLLIQPLRLSDNEYRKDAAASALRLIGDKTAIQVFIRELTSKDLKVRKVAAEALGRLGDKEAVKPLLEALSEEAGRLRFYPQDELALDAQRAIIEALGKLGDQEAVKPLLELLTPGALGMRRDSRLSWGAIRALGRIGDKEAFNPLINVLKKEDFSDTAIETLVKLGDKEAVKPLIDFFNVFISGEKREYQNTKVSTATRAHILASVMKRDMSAFFETLLRIGQPALASFRHLIDDEMTFLIMLEVALELNLSKISDQVSDQFLLALHERYRLLKETNSQNPLYAEALAGEGYKGEERAVAMLTFLGDFSILAQLQELRDKILSSARSEDTSHGGVTIWQHYEFFVKAVNKMEVSFTNSIS